MDWEKRRVGGERNDSGGVVLDSLLLVTARSLRGQAGPVKDICGGLVKEPVLYPHSFTISLAPLQAGM